MKATVFIPTYYGDRYLEEILDAVLRQKVPFEFEVLVIDTSSKDRTPEILERYAKQYSNIRYKTITKAEFSHGGTRNQAAKEARGEIVVYITQDATPAHDRWLYEITKPFEYNEKLVGVMGKQDPRPHCFPLLKTEIRSVFKGFGPDFGTTIFYKDDFIRDQGIYDAVCFYSDVNSAARRSFLTGEIGYKDIQYAEDQLFGRDLIEAGFIKAYAPRANVVHSNDILLREYKHRMFDETIGLRRVGIPVDKPSMKTVTKLITKGVLKDCYAILRDHDYSLKRKVYWLATNPLYHIEKWRGVRLAASVDLDDTDTLSRYSLEKRQDAQRNL